LEYENLLLKGSATNIRKFTAISKQSGVKKQVEMNLMLAGPGTMVGDYDVLFSPYRH
jgi:hypothetical protein